MPVLATSPKAQTSKPVRKTVDQDIRKMRGVDTETTGVDLYHGACPFILTTCSEDGEQVYWEWDVEPTTRKVLIPKGDIADIRLMFSSGETLLLQNPKFDATATRTSGIIPAWPWDRTKDTLLASHLLASNQPHDLTTLVMMYLGINISSHEEKLKIACNEARRIARSKFPDWRIAKEGLPEMPSAKSGSKKDKKGVESESPWKFDMWLLKALARELNYPNDHPWHWLAIEYANVDSSVMCPLWKVMEAELKRRDLWEIYLTRLKVLPVIADMEAYGVTGSRVRQNELKKEFKAESERAGQVCVNIAASLNYDLTLPKSGNNGSLSGFCFGPLDLPWLKVSKKTGEPSLDKAVLEQYESILPANSKQLTFVKALRRKRKRDTAITYIEGYERYQLPWEGLNEEVLAVGGQGRPKAPNPKNKVLDLDRSEIPEEGIRAVQSPRGNQSPQSGLQTPSREDTKRTTGSTQMRSGMVRKSRASIPGDKLGQHARHDIQGERRQGSGDEAPGVQSYKQGHFTNEKGVQGTKRSEGPTSRILPPLRTESPASLCNSARGLLEALVNSDWFVLHPSVNATGTETLRMSSSSPNEQNISKQEDVNLRFIFGPAPGREWWAFDYENIELRIPAYESGEEAMIELFEKPDEAPYFGSYHLLNASLIYPDLFWPLANEKGAFKKKYNATWYQWCKNAGFALIYGCQESKFDATAKKPGAYKILKAKLPKLFKLAEKYISHANKYGYVETIPDKSIGAKRGYPIMSTRSEHGGVSPTIPFNHHVQSTAMWCTTKAMIRCAAQLKEWRENEGFDGRLIMQVHDEIDFDFPVGGRLNLPKVLRLKQLMEKSGEDIGIPLRVSYSYHPNNWGEDAKLEAA